MKIFFFSQPMKIFHRPSCVEDDGVLRVTRLVICELGARLETSKLDGSFTVRVSCVSGDGGDPAGGGG